MSRAERLAGARRAVAALCAGALSGGVLLAAYTSFYLLRVPGSTSAVLRFDAERFVQVLPLVVVGLMVMFLVLGPLAHRLRKAAGLTGLWGAAIGGGLVSLALVHAVEPSVALDPHLSHSVIGAIAAVVADAWHRYGSQRHGEAPGDAGATRVGH